MSDKPKEVTETLCDCGIGEVFYSHLHMHTCPCSRRADTPPPITNPFMDALREWVDVRRRKPGRGELHTDIARDWLVSERKTASRVEAELLSLLGKRNV